MIVFKRLLFITYSIFSSLPPSSPALTVSQEADDGYNPLADNEVLEDGDEGIFFCVID